MIYHLTHMHVSTYEPIENLLLLFVIFHHSYNQKSIKLIKLDQFNWLENTSWYQNCEIQL